jgi:hypothetical protein
MGVAGVTRLELATSGVTGRRSNQIELHPRTVCNAPFIGTEANHAVAGVTRLELATSGVTGRRSNQIELHPRIGMPVKADPYYGPDSVHFKPNRALFRGESSDWMGWPTTGGDKMGNIEHRTPNIEWGSECASNGSRLAER